MPRGIEFTVPKRTDGDYVNNSTEVYKFLFDRVFEAACTQVRQPLHRSTAVVI